MVLQVIVDSREQQPYAFSGAEVRKLDFGDYALAGMENEIFIERKASVAELAGNLTTKRFWRELKGASHYPHKYLILEFSREQVQIFPAGSSIPKKMWRRIRTRAKYIFSCLKTIEERYGIAIEWCDDREGGFVKVNEIFSELAR